MYSFWVSMILKMKIYFSLGLEGLVLGYLFFFFRRFVVRQGYCSIGYVFINERNRLFYGVWEFIGLGFN